MVSPPAHPPPAANSASWVAARSCASPATAPCVALPPASLRSCALAVRCLPPGEHCSCTSLRRSVRNQRSRGNATATKRSGCPWRQLPASGRENAPSVRRGARGTSVSSPGRLLARARVAPRPGCGNAAALSADRSAGSVRSNLMEPITCANSGRAPAATSRRASASVCAAYAVIWSKVAVASVPRRRQPRNDFSPSWALATHTGMRASRLKCNEVGPEFFSRISTSAGCVSDRKTVYHRGIVIGHVAMRHAVAEQAARGCRTGRRHGGQLRYGSRDSARAAPCTSGAAARISPTDTACTQIT